MAADQIRKLIILKMNSSKTNMNFSIRNFVRTDWPSVSEIYRQGLAGRNATFETSVPDYETWIKKFNANLLWVAVGKHEVVGWAGLQPISTRKVYEGVMEVTIYIHTDFSGQGIGTALMKHLITESEKAGVWTLHASIFPENTASIKLHLQAGFREIGYREKVGQLDGKWRNTVLFERRSKKVGI
jgi:L-amino acid N-acyltransferase YncA